MFEFSVPSGLFGVIISGSGCDTDTDVRRGLASVYSTDTGGGATHSSSHIASHYSE